MTEDASPRKLGDVIAQLMQLRGYHQVQAQDQLYHTWKKVVPEQYATLSRATKVTRGVLQVLVTHPAALSELDAFHRRKLVEEFRKELPESKIKDIKFRLG